MNSGIEQDEIVPARKSKRSRNVRLTTMAAVAGSVMAAGCSDAPPVPAANAAASNGPKAGEEEVQVFENVFECAKKTDLTRQQCQEIRTEAVKNAQEEAPRFAALSDCEKEYGAGKCVPAGSEETARGPQEARQGRGYSPFMGAFIYYRSGSNTRSAPLFGKPGGGWSTANGSRLSYGGAPGKYYSSSRAMEKPKAVPKMKAASSKAAARSGFGTRAGGWALSDRKNGADADRSRSGNRSGARSRGG